MQWLRELPLKAGMESCIECFRKGNVSGTVLVEYLDDGFLQTLGIGALGDRTIISRGRDKLLRGGAEASAGPPASHAAPAARDAVTDTDGHGAGGDEHRGGAQQSKAGAEGSFKAKQGKKKPSRQERLRARNRLPAALASETHVVVDPRSSDPLVVFTNKRLGDGATGTVFEGFYHGNASVAVKRMNETERGALRELEVYHTRVLRHENLIHIHTYKQEHGLCYLVMDRCYCSLSDSTPRGREVLQRVAGSLELQRSLARGLLEGLAVLQWLQRMPQRP